MSDDKITFEIDGIEYDVEMSQESKDVVSMLERLNELQAAVENSEDKWDGERLKELEYKSFVRDADDFESDDRMKGAYRKACAFAKEHGPWKKNLVKAYKNSIKNESGLTIQIDCGDVDQLSKVRSDARPFSLDELKSLRESIKKLHIRDDRKEDKIKQMIHSYRIAVAKK